MKHNIMKSIASLLAIFIFTCAAIADTVPVRWLDGAKGYEKAIELQKQTHLPILVWATQGDCPNCAAVIACFNRSYILCRWINGLDL